MGFSWVPERQYDGRQMVHATPRYRGTTTCFSSQDDDQTGHDKIWGGSNKLVLKHTLGVDPLVQSIYFDLNTIENRTYILTGNMHWKDAAHDEWSCSIVPKTTAYSAGVSTNYNLFGGYLIIPAAGDGTIDVNVADMKLVKITQNEFGDLKGAGYWDADYNSTTKQFENITPNYTGEGEYNLFGAEVKLAQFVRNYAMLGSQRDSLTAFDAEEIGHGMRLKFEFNTIGADHDWCFAGNIAMFRDKTS